MKMCSGCKIEKDNSEFNKNSKNKDGLQQHCTACRKANYQKNREYYLDKSKKHYHNPANKEKIKKSKKEYAKKNKERDAAYNKEYRQKYKPRRNELQRLQRANNIQFNIRRNLSKAINNYFKNGGLSKNGESCLKYLPYTMAELEIHIEKQFLESGNEWMNWKNWTTYDPSTWNPKDNTTWVWNLDHIEPHSDFHYETMDCEEFRKCWALSNLRPLSAKQNIEDGATRIRHKKQLENPTKEIIDEQDNKDSER